MKTHTFLVDVSGTCNLRCPSCPVGHMKSEDFGHGARKKGFMSLEKFESIINKIISDSKKNQFAPEISGEFNHEVQHGLGIHETPGTAS